MSFWPSPLVWTALVSSALIPAALVGLSLFGLVKSCGTRYLAASLCGLAAFTTGALLCWPRYSAAGDYFLDLIPAVCIVLTAIMLFETFWSLLAFGFTMNILLCLGDAPAGLSVEALKGTLGTGAGVGTLLENRLVLLKRSGLVRREDGGLVLNGVKGRIMAWVGRFIYAVYNVRPGGRA